MADISEFQDRMLSLGLARVSEAAAIASAKLIGSGEKDSVTFDVSKLKEGEQYMFCCTFPGHSALMKGTLTLK